MVDEIRVRAPVGIRTVHGQALGRRGTVRHPHDPGVHQREELPRAQRGRTGDQAMDPAADVGVEVKVGVERQPALLDHRAHLVAEDP